MNHENILAVNVPNLVTVGVMFMGFVVLTSAILKLVKRAKPAAAPDA